LCELAKNKPHRLLASSDSINAATDDERARWSLGESVTLRGHDQPTQLATLA
jgi:adenylate cyclase